MTDAQFQEQQARVQAVYEKWKWALWLNTWVVTFYWERGKGPAESMEGSTARWERAFTVSAKWMYLDAMITVYLGTIADLTDEELESRVVHECLHLHLNETRQPTDGDWLDHEERACSMVARAFLTVRDWAKDGKL